MLKLSSKSQIFVFLTILLLLATFYFKLGYAKNINIKFSEFLNRNNLSALSNYNPKEDDLPPLEEQQEQEQEKEKEKEKENNLTQEEIQEKLDDIAEKIDILKQQVADLVESSKLKEEEINKDEKINQEDKTKEQNKLLEDKGELKTNYPKILISEVQTAGPTSEKEEFVKLYNSNNQEIDLTGWYLQKKTKNSQDYSSFASNSLFFGKKIFANGYFIICRQGFYFNGLCNIFTENSLAEGNYLALKNPNKEISDEFFTSSPAVVNYASGGGGGVAPITYPKILISEVQIFPITQRFVELYNPNNQDIDLTNWYLQRKTATGSDYSSFATKNDFSGKIILANSYFLISRQIENSDILSDITLSENNFLVLKNPNRDISDEMSFSAVDENKSLCKIDVWEICSPTPKSQNIAFFEPPVFALETPDPIGAVSPLDSIITTTSASNTPSILIYTISKTSISPNNDGIEDTTDIDWKFSEEVKVNVDIINSDGTVIFKNFYESDKVTNPRTKTWNGKDVLDAVLPDGIYTIKVVITNSAGNSITDTSKTITIANL